MRETAEQRLPTFKEREREREREREEVGRGNLAFDLCQRVPPMKKEGGTLRWEWHCVSGLLGSVGGCCTIGRGRLVLGRWELGTCETSPAQVSHNPAFRAETEREREREKERERERKGNLIIQIVLER